MKALLIIDMQNGSFTPANPRYDSDNVIGRINQLASFFREKGDLVIFIQHDGSKDNFFRPGTDEWEIIPKLHKTSTDLVVSKTVNDSFYRSKLKEELTSRGIREITVCGCATDFCVDATIKSALVNDFDITVISDAHTTANRPNLNAKQLIDYFNWQWNDFFKTEGKISVVSLDEYIEL